MVASSLNVAWSATPSLANPEIADASAFVKCTLHDKRSQILDVAPVQPVDGVALVAQCNRLELGDAGVVGF